ncbi:hypothetical protein BVJ60_18015 [Vibrio cholerae]|uniref:restriction endonuclease n=2 Tax=Vibrio cholerae TaxID=666 RepID=UPI00096B9061|nr:restriction endonuclease [Vibrio cholerae]MBO1386638.1 hypothetical protein [Vibrio cholerae]WOQ91524.1 restriction endonuclease [Vibrio cholerae]
MPILDFKEIPEAHIATGHQDTFELFARDFLEFMGYKILSDPDRGADGGADLIVEEVRRGIGGETKIHWLVSCKHKAHSGKSVTPADDANIRDRVESKKCNGFIGFYSTLSSAGLSGILEGNREKVEFQIFDSAKIESKMIHSTKGLQIAERYFPISVARWRDNNPKPAKIFSDKPSLKCHICDNELFDKEDKGIVTLWEVMRTDYSSQPKQVEHVFWTCRGRCDDLLGVRMNKLRDDLLDGWEDIGDVMIPTIYIKWQMSLLNQLKDGVIYSDEAFENIKTFLISIFPYVSRHLTDKEKERVQSLGMIPAYMGGLDYET